MMLQGVGTALGYAPSFIIQEPIGLRSSAGFRQYVPSRLVSLITRSSFWNLFCLFGPESVHCSAKYHWHYEWTENLRAKTESPLVSAVFPPKHNPRQRNLEPSSQIPVHQGEPDKALAVPQQQSVGSRPGVQCLLSTPYNDGQQVAAILPVENVSRALLV